MLRLKQRIFSIETIGVGLAALAAALVAQPSTISELIGFARIPADTFAPGPPSGRDVTPAEGLTLPFPTQPIQGFSAVVPDLEHPGWWLGLEDNGYGTKANSSDFLLRIYRVRPDWITGRVDIDADFIQIADRDGRPLTGADYDPESLVADRDGSFWIGEEFGPFILHVGRDGKIVDGPFEAEGLRSPDYPAERLKAKGGAAREPTVRRSRGFEGLTARRNGPTLLAMLEAGPVGDPPNTTRILEFDRTARRFTGRFWRYKFEGPDHSATEISPSSSSPGCDDPCESFLVIERDNQQGAAAKFKKIFRIDVHAALQDVDKTLAVDLLAIDNPNHIGGFPSPFTFPFITPESVWQMDAHSLLVVNDNNYPETGGRDPKKRDDTEFIRIRLK